MGLLGNVIDSFKWATMGEKEAAAKVMEREIKQAEAETAKREGSMLSGMNDFHMGKEGSKFFSGAPKNALRTSLLDFAHAQQANAVAAGSFMNSDIMAVADAWGIDNSTIQNAMAGYQGEVTRAGKTLMNTVATLARQYNGALTTTGGGILSPTEASFLLETIGTWNPEARMALEMENDKGKVMNAIEKKWGSDFMDWTDMDKFGRVMDKDGNYTPFEDMDDLSKSEILTTLNAVGMGNMAQALSSRWQGDDSYINNMMSSYSAEIDACATAGGGYQGTARPEATGPMKMTEETEISEEWGTKSKTTAVYDSPGAQASYNPTILASCFAQIQSQFAKEGHHKFEHKIMAARGITKDHLSDYARGHKANDLLWGQDGYVDYVKGEWIADEEANKDSSAITGIRLKYLPGSGLMEGLDARSIPRYVDLNDKDNRYLVAMELKAAGGKIPEWQTGSPGSYKQAYWSTGTDLSSFRDNLAHKPHLYSDTWDYDGEKVKLFNDADQLMESTYKGYLEAYLGATTEEDGKKALRKIKSSYESPFAQTRGDDLLNFSMEDY